MRFDIRLWLLLTALPLMAGCPDKGPRDRGGDPLVAANGPKLLSVNFDDPIAPAFVAAPVSLTAAKNETVSFALQVSRLPKPTDKGAAVLRMQPLRMSAGKDAADRIEAVQYKAYQLVPMPVDLNRAGFVRHTGLELAAGERRLPKALPRALLPLPVDKGMVNLSALRDPGDPRNPAGRSSGSGEPALLWIDLSVPELAKPGEYQTTFELLEGSAVASTLVVNLKVNDFALPADRHLLLVGRLEWESLKRLYPALFETVRPEWMTRQNPGYSKALKVLDDLVALGQQHRTQVIVPQLQPQVKWAANVPPRVTWTDFDSVTQRWLSGEAFEDKVPLGYWPLPVTENLHNYDVASRMQYWAAAAAHFDQRDLLKHSAVPLERTGTPSAARASTVESFRLSGEAGAVLASNPRLRVNVPLEDDQIQFADANNPGLIKESDTPRLITAGAGLVFGAPSGAWPRDIAKPPHWLRTDMPGLVPYVGAGGDERDVRLWAWLAFLRDAELIQWPGTLPSHDDPSLPADPNELIWFYPGEWFGLDEPVPTVQLKWLRRCEQDYEYLYLARERQEKIRTVVMARLITKPVQIPLAAAPDPTYALMCGTTDLRAWEDVKVLLAESILLRPPGEQPDENRVMDLNGRTLQWAVPQERPLLLARTTQWGWGVNPMGGNWVDLRLGVDIYNAADQRLMGALQWSAVPPQSGWVIRPQPVVIPPNKAIGVFNVQRFDMDANVHLDGVTRESRKPIDLLFTNDLTGRQSLLRVVAPVAITDRRGPQPLKIDGSLEDWSEADAIQDGPMVRMLNRPAIQRLELQYASTPTNLYSGWSQDNLYLAFKLSGLQPISPGITAERNFVDYQFRRAWGEDLCQVLVQAVYQDGTEGPILHLVCKPRGGWFVERKVDPKQNAIPWQAVVGEAIRYAAQTKAEPGGNTLWFGELAIPWAAINDARHQGNRPTLLRFNFVQHKDATGESASWAGPIDFGRDENFTGLLYVRDPAAAAGAR
jgi:hypothetical protein